MNSQPLVVDNETYFPTSVLAKKFSYTNDYLSRLAREEKVKATRVGRVWFISEKSLHEFAESTQLQKYSRQTNLRIARKKELQTYQRPQKIVSAKNTTVPISFSAWLQSVAVCACGLLVGVLGYSAHQQNIYYDAFTPVHTASVISVGENISGLARGVVEWGVLVLSNPDQDTAIGGQVVSHVPDTTNTESLVAEINSFFSDDIEVAFAASGTTYIRPLGFDNDSQWYEFSVRTLSVVENNALDG